MATVSLFAELVLALVLLVSGAAKAIDPAATRASVTALGLPERTRAPIGLSLPVVEIAIAVLLLFGIEPLAAIAAIVMLVAFAALLGRALARGVTAPCACFGRMSSAPIGPSSIVRNLVLLALAVLALGDDGGAPIDRFVDLAWPGRVVVAVVVLVGIIGIGRLLTGPARHT